MKYLKVDLTIHWGLYITHFGFTKSRPAVKVVPPTTLIGALSFGLTRIRRSSENQSSDEFISNAESIRELFFSLNYRFNSILFEYSDLTKVLSYKVREKRIISDAVGISKIYVYPLSSSNDSPELSVIYFIDPKKAYSSLGTNWETELECAAWFITRIGAKESIVSVKNVSIGEAKEITKDEVETEYSFFEDKATLIEGKYIEYPVIDWSKHKIASYSSAPYRTLVLPYDYLEKRPTKVKVRPSNDAKVLTVDGELIVT